VLLSINFISKPLFVFYVRMPSVADILKWRDRWTKMPTPVRNGLIDDAIEWLDTVGKMKCKPEEVPTVATIQAELKDKRNEIHISEQWFVSFAMTYGQQSYFDPFVRKVM
jgi:hypothetical protein